MLRYHATALPVPVRHSAVARRSIVLELESAEGLQGYSRRHDVQIATTIALQRSQNPWWLPRTSTVLSSIMASAALIAALFLASSEVGKTSLTNQLDHQGSVSVPAATGQPVTTRSAGRP
jgi:hypothetical protein